MGFLDYSNASSLNVMKKDEFSTLVRDTFNYVSDVVGRSLGPLGSTTTIIDGVYTSATKDGYTIFKNLRFSNHYRAMIYNLISAPCRKLNNTVGDGTTTAIVLTNHLFRAYEKYREELTKHYRLPREFTSAWDSVIDDAVELLTTYASPIPNDSVYDIAMVSSNGNHEISQNIQRIYSECTAPVIHLKNSPTNRCYTEAKLGYDFPANLIDDIYAKNEDLSTTENDVRIMVFHVKVTSEIFEGLIKPVNEVYRAKGIKLLVIAPGYDELLVNTILKNYLATEWHQLGKRVNLILTQYLYGKLDPHQAEDLATVLGARLIDVDTSKTLLNQVSELGDNLYDHLISEYNSDEVDPFDIRSAIGFAPIANLSIKNGSLFQGIKTDGNTAYQRKLTEAIEEHRRLLDATEADKKNISFEVARAASRIARLRMENYTYYVGADSSLQASVIHDTVDDVIKAVRSAILYGVVPGCQVSIQRAMLELEKKYRDVSDDLRLTIVRIIREAVTNLYRSVLMGPDHDPDCNTVDGKPFDDILRESLEKNMAYDLEGQRHSEKIITSVETDINVLRASSDLIKLLISGNQCVYIDAAINSSETIEV